MRSCDSVTHFPNPVIPGFNPDPSCVRVGDLYFAVTSSFEYMPALPVYRSNDLREWEQIGNVATRETQVQLAHTPSGFGVWAPTIRYHDGIFYVIVVVTASPVGCVVFTATNPAGPWSDGLTIDGIVGIDPDLAWDHDGRAFLTYSGLDLTAGVHHGILQVEVDLTTGQIVDGPHSLWSGTGLTAPEAPHLYQRGEHWYLLIAEGGTGRGHAVSIARGPSIKGPFAGAPHNPILTAAGGDGPVLSTGHAELVETVEGGDAMLLLGTRQIRVGSGFSPIGRETFATSVSWRDGWPVPQAVQCAGDQPGITERFVFTSTAELADPGWVSVGVPPESVGTVDEARGTLTLTGGGAGPEDPRPAFIGRRQRHLRCDVEVVMHPGTGAGGVALRWDERSFVSLIAEQGHDAVHVTARAQLPSLTQTWSTKVASAPVRLTISCAEPSPGGAPWGGAADQIRLSVTGPDGTDAVLAELDGRFWSVEVATPFTGRIVGMVAERDAVEFRSFRYRGHGATA